LDMRNLLGPDYMGQTAVRMRMNDFAQPRPEFRWRIVERNAPKGAVLEKIQGAESGLTDLRGVLKDRLKDRLQIAWRSADHLEHIGGCGLLLQRLAQLVEQPRIFDRDHGLVGKDPYQLDLLVGERFYSRPSQDEDA